MPDTLQVIGGVLVLVAFLLWFLNSIRSPYGKTDFSDAIRRLHEQKQEELRRIEDALKEYDDQG